MKKTILMLIAILMLLVLAYQFGYHKHKSEANERAIEMIENDEIPNYSMEVGTLDFIINNKSGELEIEAKKLKSKGH